MTAPISVLIADDHPLLRSGLRALLEAQSGIRVAGECASFVELRQMLTTAAFDVLLMDLRMPGGNGFDVLKSVRKAYPDLRIVVISSYPEEAFLLRVIQAGASGYVQKDEAPEHVVAAVRAVAAGRMYVTEDGGATLARAARPGGTPDDAGALSAREFEVLRLLGQGIAASEIAERLHLSVKTVSTYRARLMVKMGFETNADIVRYVLEHDLDG